MLPSRCPGTQTYRAEMFSCSNGCLTGVQRSYKVQGMQDDARKRQRANRHRQHCRPAIAEQPGCRVLHRAGRVYEGVEISQGADIMPRRPMMDPALRRSLALPWPAPLLCGTLLHRLYPHPQICACSRARTQYGRERDIDLTV